jgi:hypothetical protein
MPMGKQQTVNFLLIIIGRLRESLIVEKGNIKTNIDCTCFSQARLLLAAEPTVEPG